MCRPFSATTVNQRQSLRAGGHLLQHLLERDLVGADERLRAGRRGQRREQPVHLVAAGGRRIVAALVVGDAPRPITPCGGCRQKLREFAADDCPVWSADLQTVTARHTLGELLPASFGPEHLGGVAR